MKKNNVSSHPMLISRKKLFFALLFVISIIALFLPLFFKDELKQVESFGLLGVLLINFFSSATIFLPSPGMLSIPIASQIYNPIAVVLLGSLGSSFGEAVGFIFGQSTVQVLNGKKHKILFHLNRFIFKKYGLPIIFLFSAIPNPVIDGLGILAGMAGYPLHKFLFAVFLGRIIRNIILVTLAGGFHV